VESSRHILLVLTPAYVKSEWTHFEWSLVVPRDPAARDRRLLPLLLGKCDLPPILARLTYVDCTDLATRDQELEKFIRRLRIERTPMGKSVETGLNALAQLVKENRAVRDAVRQFHQEFQATSAQIDILGDYKDVHDLLHKLQVDCYNLLVHEVPRSADEPLDANRIGYHEERFQNLVERLQSLADRSSFADDPLEWIENLVQAREELLGAIEFGDPKALARALQLMKRVLALQPTPINNRLNNAANGLRLPGLVDAMTALNAELIWLVDQGQLDGLKLQQFQTGLTSLGRLKQTLFGLLHEHDRWQKIDPVLRTIEDHLPQDTEQLELFWPDLKRMTEAICKTSSEPWVATFREESARLERALSAQNPSKIREYFRPYRARASNRFFKVDEALKKLCDELRVIGEPLSAVLRMIS
jgi:hypothetical protein